MPTISNPPPPVNQTGINQLAATAVRMIDEGVARFGNADIDHWSVEYRTAYRHVVRDGMALTTLDEWISLIARMMTGQAGCAPANNDATPA